MPIIECPSGLTLEIQPLKGETIAALTREANKPNSAAADIMLQHAVQSVVEPGPYPFEPGSKPKWGSVLQGDKFAALVDIRAFTLGKEYAFRVRCRDSACKQSFEWEIGLDELPRRKLPESSATALKTANRFETTLPDGRTLTFKLLLGSDEAVLMKMRRNNGGQVGPIDALVIRTLSIEGCKPTDHAYREVFHRLGWQEVFDLIEAVQEPDCGVETKFEVACTFCGLEQEIELPFDRDFFSPTRKSRKDASAD